MGDLIQACSSTPPPSPHEDLDVPDAACAALTAADSASLPLRLCCRCWRQLWPHPTSLCNALYHSSPNSHHPLGRQRQQSSTLRAPAHHCRRRRGRGCPARDKAVHFWVAGVHMSALRHGRACVCAGIENRRVGRLKDPEQCSSDSCLSLLKLQSFVSIPKPTTLGGWQLFVKPSVSRFCCNHVLVTYGPSVREPVCNGDSG